MRKITALFLSCLLMFIVILIGDAFEKSDDIHKTGDETIDKVVKTMMAVDDYISIAEWLTGIAALATGCIALATRNKP